MREQPPTPRMRAGQASLEVARRMFFEEGRAPAALVPGAIIESWRRCQGLGLSYASIPEISPITMHELSAQLERHAELMRACRPEVQALGAIAHATQSLLVLTDPDGMILETVGDLRFASRAASVSLRPGTQWDEASTGTNAISAAILRRNGALVSGGEHFFEPHGILSCAAKPIFDPHGTMIGVLDMTSPAKQAHPHTLGLVEIAVSQIEHRQFNRSFGDADVVAISADPTLLGTAREGVLVFEGSRLVAASRTGLALAGLDFSALGQMEDVDIFRERLVRGPGDASLRARSNLRLHARFRPHVAKPRRSAGPTQTPRRLVEDAAFTAARERARAWLGTGLNVVIAGESGTGKASLALAVHAALGPAAGPLARVDGEAPREALEAALFRPDGTLAGTEGGLILIENIEALPRETQGRLSLALAGLEPGERCIITTTAAGESAGQRLRPDLRYALFQGQVRLPPLRDRADCADTLAAMARDLGGDACRFCGKAEKILLAHGWPGNLRELEGVVRAAVALAGRDALLEPEHLPPLLAAQSEGGGDLNALTLSAMQAALDEAGGNVSRAARALGVDRTTLYRRLLWKKRQEAGPG